MTTRDVFDFPAARAICAHWPNAPVPELAVADGVLERLRQVLLNLQRGAQCGRADLVPLVRQVLLRNAGENATPGWLRVPTSHGWPDEALWHDHQFHTDPNVGGDLNVSPRFPRLEILGGQADLFDDAFRELPARPLPHVAADPLLWRSLGLPTYTSDGQREAVRALLHLPPNETLIASLPTGSGKSLLAQLPALLNPEGMFTLAIVPTVALAMDQAQRMHVLLQKRFPHRLFPPLAYHSGLAREERASVRRAIQTGEQPILFTSPESATGSLRNMLEEAAGEGRLSHVMVDEAHLVTGWGNGFRPAFQLLPALVHSLRRRSGRPLRVVLASATLSAATLSALLQLFGPAQSIYLVAAVHLRSEPRYAFQRSPDATDQRALILDAIRFAPRPFILYVTRPEEAALWLSTLRAVGHTRIAAFSGKTPSVEREKLLRAWAANELDGMVATSAFGLGVDKNDVRTVLHATLPESLDRFYQEVGRGGRDGRACASLLVHTDRDARQAKSMASERLLGDDYAFERWSQMISHARADEGNDVHWLDLHRLPAHLRVSSELSALWSVRLLTLMVRAGLIELIALRDNDRGETPLDLASAAHAAVRILEASHRNRKTFSRRLAQARDEVVQAGKQGVHTMQDVASQVIEVSQALTSTYSVVKGTWSPVVSNCGGCAIHWKNRHNTGLYSPPIAGRLRRFAKRDTNRIRSLDLPMASTSLLVVAVPDDGYFLTSCERLSTHLASVVRPHSWLMEKSLEPSFGQRLHKLLRSLPSDDSFVDIVDASLPEAWTAGRNEVRVIFLDRPRPATFPRDLWSSAADLDVAIVRTSLGDPDHDTRCFIATTPHVAAATLLDKISS